MSCCFVASNDLGLEKNRSIDRLIREDEKSLSRQVKLLLLGAGESGKSTILKQMRLIYTNEGFSKSEKDEWRLIIFNNILEGLRKTIEAMEELSIAFESENTLLHLNTINDEIDIKPFDPIPIEYRQVFKDLWKDRGIQEAVQRDLDRVFSKDFLPTDQDVLRARLRTTGITETHFELDNIIYRIFDVGGQKSERKKWIHCFENVHCLMFLVAISGYDQCLIEDKDRNQMQEALMLWEFIANSHWFVKSALILFLNKIDLFKAKIVTSSITKHGFSDFLGDITNPQQTSKYFMDKFVVLNHNPDKSMLISLTQRIRLYSRSL
ncbi:g protein alpha subunit [Phlyctema vagabunda]|uniref:G protein alpha subunit n=1 Tax=Phlyctema vagabunda TaxID=108571 RepID=A0ABR4P578_9HELO